jgi:hypothetical protein
LLKLKAEVGILSFCITYVRKLSISLQWKKEEALMKTTAAAGTSVFGNVRRRT